MLLSAVFMPPNTCRRGTLFVSALLLCLVAAGSASAITPDSPEVKAMIDKGLKYLENADDDRLGGKCLIALSFYKAGRPTSHPKIVAAVEACRASAGSIHGDASVVDNYSLGLALVLLLEVVPDRERSLASRYVNEVLYRQRS